jgi:anti-anti-sigma regulatory factor
VIVVKSRIDSFSQRALVEEIRTLRELGHKKIALDLKANRFLSLPMIKHCVDVADKVASEGGAFALISCPEKTKRHFEIYGSLDHIGVVRSAAELAAPTKPNRK